MADVIITRFQAEGLKEYQNELSNTAKETKKLKDSTQSLSDEEAELVAMLDKGKQKLKELSEQGKSNTQEYKKLEKEIKATEIAMKGQGEATVSLRTKQRFLLEQFADLRLKLEQMSKAGLKGTETYKLLEAQLEQTKIEAGELNDLMGDVSSEISQLGSDTQGIDKTLRGITAVAGAFSAVQGAIGLFGAENEQLEKTLLKVNSAMALASGTQQFLTELRQKDTIFLGIQTKAQRLFNVVVGQSTGVLKLLRIALATVGIGLIISAIAILVKNFDKLKNFIFKLFPPLEKLGKNFKEIKETVVKFVKEGVLTLLNSFAKLYNNSLLVRQAIFGIGATVKSVAQIFITQFKNIGTIIEAVWKAIRSGGKDIKGIFTDAFTDIKDRSKKTGEDVINNFKNGFKNAKDSELKELTLADLDFGGGKAGEKEGKSFSENLVKEVKTGLDLLKEELSKAQKELEDLASKNVIDGDKNIEEINKVREEITKLEETIKQIEAIIDNNPIVLKPLLEVTPQATNDFIKDLTDQLNAKEEQLKEAFSISKFLGQNPKDNPEIAKITEQIRELERQIKSANEEFEELINPKINEALADIGNTDFGLKIEAQYTVAQNAVDSFLGTQFNAIAESKAKLEEDLANGIISYEEYYARLSELNAEFEREKLNASALASQKLNDFVGQIGDVRQARLEDQYKRGLISEEKYQKELAKIKTRQAKADKFNALFQIAINTAQAVSKALASAPPPANFILASLVAAQGLAQTALVLATPLPKFRKGGIIKGASHEAGGVDIPVKNSYGINAEGGEFMFSKDAVNKIGVKNLELMNKKPNLFKNVFYPKPVLIKKDVLQINNADNKQIKKLGNILREEFGLLKIDIGNADRKKLQAMKDLKVNIKARS